MKKNEHRQSGDQQAPDQDEHLTLTRSRQELARIGAERDVSLELDREFEPKFGELMKVTIGGAYWHLVPEHLLELLGDVPDDGGAETLKRVIESKATLVWHGPADGPGREGQP